MPSPHRPPTQSAVNWRIVIPVLAGAAIFLVIAASAAVWVLIRPAGERPAPAPPTHTLQVQGVMNLSRGQFIWAGGADTTCSGWRGFDDIRGGTEVTVTDASGRTLAVGQLQTGQATGITDDTATACRLPFSITGVPGGVGPYGVEIGHRGVNHYTEGHLTGLEFGFD